MRTETETMWLLHDAIREMNDAAYQMSLLMINKKGDDSNKSCAPFYFEAAGKLGDATDAYFIECSQIATAEDMKGIDEHIQQASNLLRILNNPGKEGK